MTQPQDTDIPIEEMKSALLRSGYLLEQRVRSVLEEMDYHVQTSDAYPDEVTGKSRELDIYALKLGRAGQKELDFLWGVILCECINNPQPLVLFPSEEVYDTHNVKHSGVPTRILEMDEGEESWERLSDFLRLYTFHHYCTGLASTQYCSFQLKRNPREWMAFHSEDHNDAFNTLSMALESAIAEHYRTWSISDLQETGEEQEIDLQFYYPLLVLQGKLYAASVDEGELSVEEIQHGQYRRAHFSDKRRETYLIDVVTEGYLKEYLETVEKEMSAINRRLRHWRNRPKIRESINRILAEARNRPFTDIRAALDWDKDMEAQD